ncbi:hypothetical protein GN956_G7672 [Arapaima gigas]
MVTAVHLTAVHLTAVHLTAHVCIPFSSQLPPWLSLVSTFCLYSTSPPVPEPQGQGDALLVVLPPGGRTVPT